MTARRHPIDVRVHMDDRDFDQLWTTHSAWGGDVQAENLDRFENMGTGKHYAAPPERSYDNAYWFGDNYANVLLARSYLRERFMDCEVFWDLAEPCEYVIFTDYESHAS